MGDVQEGLMTRILLLLVVGLSLAIAGRPVIAHHSETAEFDPTKPVKIRGTIKQVEWMNPHVWFFVDVTEEGGTVTTWGFSTAPPGALMRRGITKDTLKIGAEVTVEGVRARDGSTTPPAGASSTPTARTPLRQRRARNESPMDRSAALAQCSSSLAGVRCRLKTFRAWRTASRISPACIRRRPR